MKTRCQFTEYRLTLLVEVSSGSSHSDNKFTGSIGKVNVVYTVLDIHFSRSNTTTLNHLLSFTFAVESKALSPFAVKSDVDARWACDESDGDVWIGEGLGGVLLP